MVVTLLADDQLALHADAEVVARVAVRGREIGRARELLRRGRRVVEQAEQRARDRVAHAEQHRLPRSLAQRRFVEREIERVGADVHAECCKHAHDPKTRLRVACDPMSEPGAADERASFNSEMGFTYRIEEGLGLGWGWHADELSVPGTGFPHASALVTYAGHAVGSPLLGRDRAAPLVDRRPALPDPLRASARPDRDGGSTPEDRPHHDAGEDVVLGSRRRAAVRDLLRHVHRLAASRRRPTLRSVARRFCGAGRRFARGHADGALHGPGRDPHDRHRRRRSRSPFGCPQLLQQHPGRRARVRRRGGGTVARHRARAGAPSSSTTSTSATSAPHASARAAEARRAAGLRAGATVEVETRDRGADNRTVSYVIARCVALDG